jgi:hypothetical protein
MKFPTLSDPYARDGRRFESPQLHQEVRANGPRFSGAGSQDGNRRPPRADARLHCAGLGQHQLVGRSGISALARAHRQGSAQGRPVRALGDVELNWRRAQSSSTPQTMTGASQPMVGSGSGQTTIQPRGSFAVAKTAFDLTGSALRYEKAHQETVSRFAGRMPRSQIGALSSRTVVGAPHPRTCIWTMPPEIAGRCAPVGAADRRTLKVL